MVFIGFAFAEDKFLPNGINPEMQEINTTWGLILFFMWPVLIFASYKFIEITLRKTGEDI
jgi:hypothetical protein